ncbi:MAG: hypothetical protein PF517_22685 [Salinivirgaceae bacterium]|jgi:hypothetical protein|nr:hypothetical protein [Salinivirgaceae bacterium]
MIKHIISIVSIALFMHTGSMVQAQFIQTITNLNKFNTINTNEQIYVHTNCEVYAPGDTLWFKAYVRNKASLKKSNLSTVLYVFLMDENGVIIGQEKMVITDSYSNGYLVINRNIEEKIYRFVCYSSWMKNFDEGEVFSKKMLIEKEFKEDYSFSPQFDKENYLPGDTVTAIIKCYNNDKNKFKDSKFRFRLLADDNLLDKGTGSTFETENIPLTFILPDSRAEKTILRIWDELGSADFTLPINSKIHVDFFPEGGNCLIDALSTVAFKSVLSSGMPVEISGLIIDELGQEYASVKSEHKGMGKFIFAPQKEHKYFLKVTEPKGIDENIILPAAKEEGWTITAQNARSKIYVEVKNNLTSFDTCLLTLSVRGYCYYFKLITSQTQAAFPIPTPNLPAGIGVLTLLSKNNLPLSERLVFINHDSFIEKGISTEGSQYLCRDLVTLDVSLQKGNIDFSTGQYSLTVYDDIFGGADLIDEPNIISSNYLASEIRGEIHDPNYYFQSKGGLVAHHLDLLLLTQGWRNYSYLEKVAEIDSVNPPVNQDLVKGSLVKRKFGGTEIPTEGNVLVYFAGTSERLKTDKGGSFSFIPEYSLEYTSSILLSARDKQGSDDLILRLDDNGFEKRMSESFISSSDSSKTLLATKLIKHKDVKREFVNNSINNIWIDEVKINAKKGLEYEDVELGMIKDFSMVKSTPISLLKSSTEIKDVIEAIGYYCFEENDKLKIRYRGKDIELKFIVDGMDKGKNYPNIQSAYSPADLKNLIVATGMEVSMVYNNEAVAYLQTDEVAYKKRQKDNTPNSISIEPLQVVKEFYSPKYVTQADKDLPVPDLRKAIYWNPDIKIDSSGNANISFYNSDRYTKVKCVFEGITEDGMPVYCESFYDISSSRE